MRPVRAPMRQRGALPRQENWRPSRRFHEVRELPALHASVPHRALAITRWPQVDAGSAVWTESAMDDITAQAQTGGVLLASMGNPKSYHIYWEHLLLNASQVTNPSIDPLREPMETRVVLGSPPEQAARERAHPHRRLSPAAPAVVRRARHVLGHELRLGGRLTPRRRWP